MRAGTTIIQQEGVRDRVYTGCTWYIHLLLIVFEYYNPIRILSIHVVEYVLPFVVLVR